MFFVVNKEKLYAYVISVFTIFTLFFMSYMLNNEFTEAKETSVNIDANSELQENNSVVNNSLTT